MNNKMNKKFFLLNKIFLYCTSRSLLYNTAIQEHLVPLKSIKVMLNKRSKSIKNGCYFYIHNLADTRNNSNENTIQRWLKSLSAMSPEFNLQFKMMFQITCSTPGRRN